MFNALLRNELLTEGYVVASPEPDLGDDLWFVQLDDIDVRRGQIKSVHTCTIQGKDSRGSREYNVSLQVDTSPQMGKQIWVRILLWVGR